MSHEPTSSRIHFIAATACVIAFGASILGCDGAGSTGGTTAATPPANTPPSNTPPKAPPPAAARGASLAIEPETLDMGDLIPAVPVTKKVKLTNRTSRPLTITNAIADCSCTTPTWPEAPIAPGATVETDITINAGPKQGVALTKRVTFQMQVDSGGGAVEELAFLNVVGKVGLFVEIAPEMIRAPSDDVAEPGFGEVTLKGADNTPFKVLGFDPPVASDSSAEATLEHTVRIDWTKWRAEKKSPRLTILTDHPKTPELQVLVRRTAASTPAPAGTATPPKPTTP